MSMSIPTTQLNARMVLALDPVRDTQAVFRTTLEALARPGQVTQLPIHAHGAPRNPWIAALLISLLDQEMSVTFEPGSEDLKHFVLQRTGARATALELADFVVADAATFEPHTLHGLRRGSLEYPDDSATLVLQIESFGAGTTLTLEGPGIPHRRTVSVDGLSQQLIDERRRLERMYPRGVDLIIVDSAGRMAGIPRSSRVGVIEGA